MHRAQQLAKQYPDAPVPIHLRNAPTKLMKDLGYGKDYKWEADFKHGKGFLPDELKDEKIIVFTSKKTYTYDKSGSLLDTK